MDNNTNQQQQHDVQALARALHAGDLARVQAAPPALLRRSDACIPLIGMDPYDGFPMLRSKKAAPLACAIEYALGALSDHRNDPRMWRAAQQRGAGEQMMLSDAAVQLINNTEAFAVLDWLLQRFPELIDTPLQSGTFAAIYSGPESDQATLTPLRFALDGFYASRNALEALAVLERLLLRYGASALPQPRGTNDTPFAFGADLSPLCYAMDNAHTPAGAHAVHVLIAAGACLAPGESVIAVQRVTRSGAGPQVIASALRALRALSRDALFETLQEQQSVANIWLRYTEAAPETLDALRQLGLRLDVVRAALAEAAAARRAEEEEAAAAQPPDPVAMRYTYRQRAPPPEKLRAAEAALRAAEAASGERAMRTLAVRGLAIAPGRLGGAQSAARRSGALPLEIVSDIARRAGADAPSWHLGVGTMNPPRSTPIVAADARADARSAAPRAAPWIEGRGI